MDSVVFFWASSSQPLSILQPLLEDSAHDQLIVVILGVFPPVFLGNGTKQNVLNVNLFINTPYDILEMQPDFPVKDNVPPGQLLV